MTTFDSSTQQQHQQEQQQAKVPINDSKSTSCQKCVRVLRNLIAGLQEDSKSSNSNNKSQLHHWNSMDSTTTATTSTTTTSTFTRTKREPAPLTLLKAIAGLDKEQLKIEMVEDGVKLHLPVESTMPEVLGSWSRWFPPERHGSSSSSSSSPNKTPRNDDDEDNAFGDPDDFRTPLAFSIQKESQEMRDARLKSTLSSSSSSPADEKKPLVDPLTIELKCRKCASTGPEAGARAFLMGPQPLSVIVCHNRIRSQREEVEEILTHELVHLYDVQTLQLDLQQCENLAYSEVRAAKAAECKDSWHPHLQSYCVRQKAICATNNLFPAEGRQCIQKVFAQAFGDNRPFASPSTSSSSSSSSSEWKK